MAAPEDGFDQFAPENVAAGVAWLASDLSAGVSGQVLKIQGGLAQIVQNLIVGFRRGKIERVGCRCKQEVLFRLARMKKIARDSSGKPVKCQGAAIVATLRAGPNCAAASAIVPPRQ